MNFKAYQIEDCPRLATDVAAFLSNYLEKSGMKCYVLGVSGGVDSAVLARLLEQFKIPYIGVNLPVTEGDNPYINELEAAASAPFIRLPIGQIVASFANVLGPVKHLTAINVPPRIRMTCLYAVASENDGLVLGTDNMDEYRLGYFTKWGDGGCDILPLAELTKLEIYRLATYLNVPARIINRAPSADLYESQTDADELGFTYAQSEAYFRTGSTGEAALDAVIANRVNANRHKTNPLPIYRRKQ